MAEQNNPQQNETQQTLSSAANTGKKVGNEIGQGLKKVGKAIGKAAKKVGKAIGKVLAKIFSNPIVWKILIIVGIVLLAIALIVGIIIAVCSIFEFDSYDKNKGVIAAHSGIAGDSFYGARYIYEDKESAAIELKDYYLKLTYTMLDDIDETKNLVTYVLDADYKQDGYTELIATRYANKLANTTGLSIKDAALNIDHYGFTAEEWQIIIDTTAETLKEKWAYAGITLNDIKNTVTEVSEDSKYSKYSTICSTLFVWDCLLDGDEAMLENIPKKNFIGYIYMPKENVTLTSVSYVFIVDNGPGVNVEIKQKVSSSQTQEIAPMQTADSTWYTDEDGLEKWIEHDVNINLQKFSAIDTNNIKALSQPTTINSLVESGEFSKYFKDTAGDYSGIKLLESVNAENYYYLQMTSASAFNFADYIIEYKAA